LQITLIGLVSLSNSFALWLLFAGSVSLLKEIVRSAIMVQLYGDKNEMVTKYCGKIGIKVKIIKFLLKPLAFFNAFN